MNMVYKEPPYFPAAGGFGEKDAKFLAENGFNAVRLGFAWNAVKPRPGVYDDNYIEQIKQTRCPAAPTRHQPRAGDRAGDRDATVIGARGRLEFPQAPCAPAPTEGRPEPPPRRRERRRKVAGTVGR
nr:hypothetical protein OG409_05555 [Streptomyces sp. NBC_00974]